MNLLFRLIIPKFIRNALRRPCWLLLALFVCSGWLREMLLGSFGENLLYRLSSAAYQAAKYHQFSDSICSVAYAITLATLATLVTLTVIVMVGRVVIDFPAFTKAMFWAVTRSYEHKLSRVETLVLVGIPSAMSVTILATGVVSLAGFFLTVIGMLFHSTSYDFSRLKKRTDDVMKMRSNTSLVTPPIADGTKSEF